MSRRLLASAGAVAVLAVTLTACGIPDRTGVIVDGRGPVSEHSAVNGTGRVPPARTQSDDVEQFALNFLEASAGETAGVYDRVNAYIAPDSQKRFREKAVNEVAINVVRLTEQTPRIESNQNGSSTVTIAVQQVGVLRADGTVGEPVATDTEYRFVVGKILSDGERAKTSTGLYVLDPPPVLLMSTDALTTYYRPQTIYFWNADRSALVPDLRYLPWIVPEESRPTRVLDWLTGGPADWLTPTAVPLPEGTTRIGNVPESRGRLQVNLAAQAGGVDDEPELEQLFKQLVWSLRDNIHGELELKIQGQQRKVANAAEYLKNNRIYRLAPTPRRFVVYNGAVRALSASAGGDGVPIDAATNRGVQSAALASDGSQVWAALVSTVDSERRLLVGAGPGMVRTFAATSATSYESMGRPVWLRGSDPGSPIGLVVADGRLYRFGIDARLTEVRLPNVAGRVTSVGAALDAHRIAFVANGGLYVAALSIDGGVVTAGPARRLATSLRDPSAVEWSGESSLVVAGVKPDGRTAIYQITVDGADETAVVNQVPATKVSQLAAYPDNPVVRASTGSVLYEANGVAFSGLERINADEVAGGATAPPTAGPTLSPNGAGNPTAPFFLY